MKGLIVSKFFIFLYNNLNINNLMYNSMNIVENLRKLIQSEEPITMIQKGVKYKKVENGWVPILNIPTISLFDCIREREEEKRTQTATVN